MKFECDILDASRVCVKIDGNIDEYAKAFLAIYNNVKNDSSLLKMYNNYSDSVYVVCEDHVVDAAVEFLSQFGEIKKVEKIKVYKPYLSLDFEYPDDVDVEFLEVEE